MSDEPKRDEEQFIKEIQSLSLVINEEIGELTKAINNYCWKPAKSGQLDTIFQECQDCFAPLVELHEKVRRHKQ